MDYLYKLLPVELVSIIEKILHEMYFVDTIKKLNAINNLLLTEKYPKYTGYNNKSKEEVDNYFKDRKDKLLVVYLTDEKNKWEKLCAFLNKEIPAVNFPHSNNASLENTVS